MMYPFMTLEDGTEIVHSERLENDEVKVYVEKPVEGGFFSAECYLPEYRWENVEGFGNEDIKKYTEFLETTAHIIIRLADEGGFDNAANF